MKTFKISIYGSKGTTIVEMQLDTAAFETIYELSKLSYKNSEEDFTPFIEIEGFEFYED